MCRIALLLSLALAGATACAPLGASPLVRVDVVDREHGHVLPRHRHRGDTWIAGRPGHHYSVRLTNATGERVLVVLSVDGVNAVTGQTADPSQAGYVLAPWQTHEVTGWRKSLDGVARFVFTDLPDSYAARTGRPDHVGVIGVAAYRERRVAGPVPYPAPPVAGSRRVAEAPAAAGSATADRGDSHAAQQRQRIGTGHGSHEYSRVGRTSFVRASTRPGQVTELRYDAPARLAALGVRIDADWPYYAGDVRPRAFPGGFVPDPR